MDKITLDKGIIGALASEPRVAILKTVHKHLTILIESGLVKKVNKDNKWAHYELTDKGTEILHPRKMTRIIALVSAAILSFVVGMELSFYFIVRKKTNEKIVLSGV